MDISAAIAPINLLTGASAINPVVVSLPTSATTGFSTFDSGSTIVELSGLGQLLSAVSSFQSNLAALSPGSGGGGVGRNFGTDVGSLAAETQFFVDAFNGLQNAVNGLAGPAGPLGAEPLAGQVAAAFNSQATATFNNGTGPTSLAQIGINFQPSSVAGSGGSLSIDINALQSAFQANAAGTFSLLAQAAGAFGDLAASLAGRTNSLFASVGVQAQANAAQESLLTGLLGAESGLLGTGTGLLGAGSGGLGLVTLLALESSFGQGNVAPSLLQQIVGLNQFALVSSLLG